MSSKTKFWVVSLLIIAIPLIAYAYDSSFTGAQVDAEITRSAGRNTTVGNPGSDAELVSEQAVREALDLKQDILAEGAFVDGDKTDLDANTAAKHTQDTDTALGVLGTKGTPIDADKAVYRDSTDSDALVTATFTEMKAFLKTYFDTLYGSGGGDLLAANNLSDVANAVTSYGNIKQSGSVTVTGALELATPAETVTGTDATRAVTPDGLTDKMAAPGPIGGTTPAVGTFTSITTADSPTPTNTFNDSDDAVGSSSTFSNSSGGVNDVIATQGVEDSTGENTPYFKMNGVNEANEFVKVIDPQAGTNGKTLLGDPDTWDITPALHKGGAMTANAAGEDELDAVAIGMELSLQVDDGIVAIFNPNAADTIWRNGVALTQGEALISDDTAGTVSSAVCEYRAANLWNCWCSPGMAEETP